VSVTDLLLDLQAIDSTLDQLNQRLAAVKADLRETDELIAARRARAEAEQLVRQRRAERKDLELAAAALDDKIQQAEKRLYGGLVKNPKELLDLQNDIHALKRQKTTTDDQLFAAMLALENAESTQTRAAAEAARIEADWHAAQTRLQAAGVELEADIARQTVEQQTLRAGLGEAELALYDQLRRRKGGLAVVEIMGSTCPGCGVRVTANVLQQLAQSGQPYARCGNCERILVRP
jgi:predicted  nucleic acid-binding Zn-ribbon protein